MQIAQVQQSPKGWHAHDCGCVALLQMRGAGQFERPLGWHLFLLYQGSISRTVTETHTMTTFLSRTGSMKMQHTLASQPLPQRLPQLSLISCTSKLEDIPCRLLRWYLTWLCMLYISTAKPSISACCIFLRPSAVVPLFCLCSCVFSIQHLLLYRLSI